MTTESKKLLTCPRCLGDGEEPGVPWDDELGTPLCNLCDGKGEVPAAIASAAPFLEEAMITAFQTHLIETYFQE